MCFIPSPSSHASCHYMPRPGHSDRQQRRAVTVPLAAAAAGRLRRPGPLAQTSGRDPAVQEPAVSAESSLVIRQGPAARPSSPGRRRQAEFAPAAGGQQGRRPRGAGPDAPAWHPSHGGFSLRLPGCNVYCARHVGLARRRLGGQPLCNSRSD